LSYLTAPQQVRAHHYLVEKNEGGERAEKQRQGSMDRMWQVRGKEKKRKCSAERSKLLETKRIADSCWRQTVSLIQALTSLIIGHVQTNGK
jgi:hypothetical protein